jgi:hypothetical protein
MPSMAAELMLEGYDNQSLREIAGMSNPTLRDEGKLFDKALVEAGFTKLPAVEAVGTLAWDIAKAITIGEIDPERGARELAGLWSGNRGIDELVEFYGCTDEYDDHPTARGEIDEDVIRLSQAFLEAHPELAA